MLALFTMAVGASAQIQLLYTDFGRNVIDRNKKLFWMDGDSDPCFDIQSYKKGGNKEVFVISEKEDKNNKYKVTIILDSKSTPIEIELSHPRYGVQKSKVKTTSGDKDEDDRLYKYFGELAGYPPSAIPSAKGGVPTAKSVKEDAGKSAGAKVGDAAKGAVNKVKGLFKKKK